MNRQLAFIFALAFALLTISSACAAQAGDWIHFSLEPEHSNRAKIHASFRDNRSGRGHGNWSADFAPSELIGLDVPSFRGAGTRPLRFAVVREAGRLDCSGNGGSNRAEGNCRFTADVAFIQLLITRGIGRPTSEQTFGLMAVNARREDIDAVAAARYPTPTIDNLMALSALGVDGRYIAGMTRAGYRPKSIEKLIECKALGVTPDYIAGFERIGYRDLPVSSLVELKALGITPEFARSVVQPGTALPPVHQLVEMKMFGRRR
jgi:hypothetical protein